MAHPNEYNKAGADFVNLTNINGTEAFLLANLQPCQSGIANDTNAFVFADKDGNKYVARPVDALTAGTIPQASAAGFVDSVLKANAYGAYIGANAATAEFPIHVTVSQNDKTAIIVRNSTSDTLAKTGFESYNGGAEFDLMQHSAGFTTVGNMRVASSVVLSAINNSAGMRVGTLDNTPLILFSSDTEVMRLIGGMVGIGCTPNAAIRADVAGTVRCTELVTTPKLYPITVGSGVMLLNPNGYAVIYVSGYDQTASNSPYGLSAGTFDGQRLTLINSGSGADRLQSALCGSATVRMWLNGVAYSSIDFKHQNCGESIELIWSACCSGWVVNSATGTYNA